MPTPPPLYTLTIFSGLTESFSVIRLLKVMPERDDGMFSNKVAGLYLQAKTHDRTALKKITRSSFIQKNNSHKVKKILNRN
jgi:hypothetical protein